MTALSVVTAVVSTEGCGVEHTEQDGGVRTHAPLWRRLIFSIATCLVVLAQGSEQRAQADAFQTRAEELRTRVLPPYLVEETVCSTKSTVFDAWDGENLSRCAQIFCTRIKFSKGDEQDLNTVLVHRVGKSRASFPTTLSKNTRDVPQRSTTRVTRAMHARVSHNDPQ